MLHLLKLQSEATGIYYETPIQLAENPTERQSCAFLKRKGSLRGDGAQGEIPKSRQGAEMRTGQGHGGHWTSGVHRVVGLFSSGCFL